jgi:hypothetical protein
MVTWKRGRRLTGRATKRASSSSRRYGASGGIEASKNARAAGPSPSASIASNAGEPGAKRSTPTISPSFVGSASIPSASDLFW